MNWLTTLSTRTCVAGLFASLGALKEHVEDLPLVVDGAPQIHPFPGDPNDHLVEVPSSARTWAALPQLALDMVGWPRP
jgi:hypothetical protein